MNTFVDGKLVKYSKHLLALSMLATLAVSPAYAHEGAGDDHCDRSGHNHWQHHDRSEFIAKRNAQLHDKLKLSASQEVNWATYTEKTKLSEPMDKQQWEELAKLPTPERLDRILALKTEHLKKFEARNQAVKAFYSTLTSDQKTIFDASFHHPSHHHGDA